MLVITGFFENGKFVPDNPVSLPEKTRAVIKVEESALPVIPKEAWVKFRKEPESIEGEELPENFAEQFKIGNFRTPEEKERQTRIKKWNEIKEAILVCDEELTGEPIPLSNFRTPEEIGLL
jgi:hypothetical protein